MYFVQDRSAHLLSLCAPFITVRSMKRHRVAVIDGPLPGGIWEHPNMEPSLVTDSEHVAVLEELMQREPLFHRPEFGTARQDFERMAAPEFWEVSASGRRFSRQ